MESIVLELQREAMSSESNVRELLRKSLVIARKLKIPDFEKWVNLELSGYRNHTDKAPEYREIHGTLQWFNQFRGWCPVVSEDPELMDIITNVKLFESISELEQLVIAESNNLVYQLTQHQQNLISSLGDGGIQEFRLLFGKNQAQRVIDTVKDIILDWTIKLEEDGILGEGITFSDKEKQEANRQNYTVNNFYGNTSGVQIQQHTQHSTQTQINEMDLEKVESFISNLNNNINQITELEANSQKVIEKEVKKITKQIKAKKPKHIVLKESINTIRNILEGVAGNFVAQALLYQISQIGL
ncbi:AbiTii domain-containing protein [Aquibacillus kalidii]|uniref:AbiTii domain-containing protein n=1 Tax=Aquibacillus kalidii TaxID=2762597 RepID=UPI001646DF1A|nr:hypothetical protein [Aquibacillus kalidii]